jgi:hypothetical protein
VRVQDLGVGIKILDNGRRERSLLKRAKLQQSRARHAKAMTRMITSTPEMMKTAVSVMGPRPNMGDTKNTTTLMRRQETSQTAQSSAVFL